MNTHIYIDILSYASKYISLHVLQGEYSVNSVKESLATKQVPTGSLRFRFVLNQTYLGAQACEITLILHIIFPLVKNLYMYKRKKESN